MDTPEIVRCFAIVGQVGFVMAACIVGGLFLGMYADEWLGTGGVLTIVLMLAGIAAGGYASYKLIVDALGDVSSGHKDDE